MALLGRTVLKAQMHGTIHVAGLGQAGPTLDASPTGKLGLSAEITYTDGGVHCKGKGPTGVNYEFIVPNAMCMVIQLAPESK